MPAGSPFTRLCQIAASAPMRPVADLHVHSTASDGLYSPQEIVAIAGQLKLIAIAITDHDTLGGYQLVRHSAGIELIAGVEISTEFQGRDLHLLGYFVGPEHGDLNRALESLRQQRRERFEAIVGRLNGNGASFQDDDLQKLRSGGNALGRRHLARLIVQSKKAGNVSEAFSRFLNAPELAAIPRARMPVGEAIELVRAAGGVSSWAHPAADASVEQMSELRAMGLRAVECEYPWAKPSHGRKLRAMAEELGLAITGGSDCHGPMPRNRGIGVKGINRLDLDRMKLLTKFGMVGDVSS